MDQNQWGLAVGDRIGKAALQRFQDIYAEAQDNPRKLTANDIDFLTDYNIKVEQYGEKTFISEKQIEWLKSIAEKLEM